VERKINKCDIYRYEKKNIKYNNNNSFNIDFRAKQSQGRKTSWFEQRLMELVM